MIAAPRVSAQDDSVEPLFNWDLISLEQNNPRFNGSVLSGFHSVRSPGVTPHGGWKIGVGMLYTHEKQVAADDRTQVFDRNEILFNPKLNYGFFPSFEAGVGATGGYASGREVVGSGATQRSEFEDSLDLKSIDLGLKWNFYDADRFRAAASFDARLANHRGRFGTLPGSFYNFEVDADFAVTSRFTLAGNLQFMTSDGAGVQDQVIGDLAAAYVFTPKFRGMLFSTIQEDDLSGTVLGFVGIAGQWVVEQHSFTVAVDLQLNDAGRQSFRTEDQLDLEFSYTFTF